MDSVDNGVMEILRSGKRPDRYMAAVRLLNHGDCGENEGQPQRKRFLGWGCIGKNKSVLIIA